MPGDVKEGGIYDFDIVRTGRKGDGMAYINGFVVFVRGAREGPCRAKVLKVNSTCAIAEKV